MSSDNSSKRTTTAKQAVSGHWIGNTPVLKSQVSTRQEELYLMKTNMNINHRDLGEFQHRARNFNRSLSEEMFTLMHTEAELQDHTSKVFQQSSHMVHTQRGDIASRHHEINRRAAHSLQQAYSTVLSPQMQHERSTLSDMVMNGKQGPLTPAQAQMTGIDEINTQRAAVWDNYQSIDKNLEKAIRHRRQGDLAEYNPQRASEYDNLMDMMVSGKAGPLTKTQSQLGVEAAAAGHHILRSQRDAATARAYSHSRVGVQDRVGHPTTTRTGVDLSGDLESNQRQASGLPVMMGTSGSSSDIVRSHTAAVQQVNTSSAPTQYAAPGLSDSEATQATVQLTHRWMRVGSPAQGVETKIDQQLNSHGQQRVSKGPLFTTQTHTLNEIETAVKKTRNPDSHSTPSLPSKL
ncbi:hypothetical protein AB835_04960 [Candidatus Endobugula sertula]|uniref:Uncharacterized protein n=1 Tax=Candidatus Endobugula sertula TaxID=62101 RepID=A0A1D2QRM9_9GAMM|nr:hypothetical protein AB835_04960 [Candidatus Endobugula sertula]